MSSLNTLFKLEGGAGGGVLEISVLSLFWRNILHFASLSFEKGLCDKECARAPEWHKLRLLGEALLALWTPQILPSWPPNNSFANSEYLQPLQIIISLTSHPPIILILINPNHHPPPSHPHHHHHPHLDGDASLQWHKRNLKSSEWFWCTAKSSGVGIQMVKYIIWKTLTMTMIITVKDWTICRWSLQYLALHWISARISS